MTLMSIKQIVILAPCISLQLMVSRLTYITLIAEKIEKHFKKFTAIDEQDEVWFESNGQALKW